MSTEVDLSFTMFPDDAADIADVRATLAGDGDAYARLVERHCLTVQRQMRNFSRDVQVSDELAQDVFTEAYLSLHTFRGDAPFRHWLARIGTLYGYKYWRKRDKRRRDISLATIFDVADKSPQTTTDPAAAAQLLFDLLEMLPPADRLVMTLMYLEGCQQEEIAARLRCTRVVVAVRIHRAKKKLQKIGEEEPWKGRISWVLD
ncbi:MAG: RNA polymerase sigma factor [Thermoguttaceae bacterium]